MFLLSLSVCIGAIVFVVFFIKRIIFIAHTKHLFDEPVEARKVHKTKTPNLGGIAIVGAVTLISCLSFKITAIDNLNYIIFSFAMLFLSGVTDDLIGLHAYKKVIVQCCSAVMVTLFGDWRFTGFYGLFGLNDISFFLSVIISSLFIVFIINAFNLIDGINCLAGGISFLICAAFTFYFWRIDDLNFMLFSVLICGCLAGFLWFNKTPAKIFMGDTGSNFLGFTIALLSIHFLEINKLHAASGLIYFSSAPNVIISLLVIPVYDTLRVFIMRIAKSTSPFVADRNHVHHRLIDLGLSHLQAAGLLVIFNAIFLCIAFLLRNLRPEYFLLFTILLMIITNQILYLLHSKKIKTDMFIKSSLSEPRIKLVFDRQDIIKN